MRPATLPRRRNEGRAHDKVIRLDARAPLVGRKWQSLPRAGGRHGGSRDLLCRGGGGGGHQLSVSLRAADRPRLSLLRGRNLARPADGRGGGGPGTEPARRVIGVRLRARLLGRVHCHGRVRLGHQRAPIQQHWHHQQDRRRGHHPVRHSLYGAAGASAGSTASSASTRSAHRSASPAPFSSASPSLLGGRRASGRCWPRS